MQKEGIYANRGLSPRKRGCFLDDLSPFRHLAHFPAQAGVFPTRTRLLGLPPDLPRSRGGVSYWLPYVTGAFGSSRSRGGCSMPLVFGVAIALPSLLARGCFHEVQGVWRYARHFSAQAGVIPTGSPSGPRRRRIPRIAGVFPPASTATSRPDRLPRKQAGVFPSTSSRSGRLRGFPRSRGGVSVDTYVNAHDVEASLLTRGWFPDGLRLPDDPEVFPARAGVVPTTEAPSGTPRSLPRLRGGDSCYRTEKFV